jgi:eukaryotic-like serine/threonine-protein kinase
VVFSSDRGGAMDLWRIAVDPSTGRALSPPEPLTRSPGLWSHSPSFARDGRRFIFVAGAATTRIHRIAFDPIRRIVEGQPTVVVTGGDQPSVHGDSIAFIQRVTQDDVVVMSLDGTNRRRLTDDRARDRAPRFSPDGRLIAFYSNRGGAYDFWLIRPDGSGLRQITQIGTLWFPVWSPDGRRMAGYELERGGFLFDPHRPFDPARVERLPPLDEAATYFIPYSWSPDGTTLAGLSVTMAGVDGPLFTYSIHKRTYHKLASPGNDVSWVDNRHVLILSPAGSLLLVDVIDDTSTPLAGTMRNVQAFTISADRRWIYTAERVSDASVWMATLTPP